MSNPVMDGKSLYYKYSKLQINSSSNRDVTRTAQQSTITSRSKVLDNLIICMECDGCGLKKISYNCQVREINCDLCKGEGLLAKNTSRH